MIRPRFKRLNDANCWSAKRSIGPSASAITAESGRLDRHRVRPRRGTDQDYLRRDGRPMGSKTIGRRSSAPVFRSLKPAIFWSRRLNARSRLEQLRAWIRRALADSSRSATTKEKSSACATCCATTRWTLRRSGSSSDRLLAALFIPEAKLAVLCDAEIFGRYQSPSARRLALRRSRLRGGRAPIDFSEIAEGDLVVHLEHGIGKYRGIQRVAAKWLRAGSRRLGICE